MNVYVMRHGETNWNSKKLIQGSSDIELNDNGRRLAQITSEGMLREGLHFQRIYTSPYKRALETAKIVNQLQNVPVIKDDRLKEICFGVYEGKCLNEILSRDKNVYYCFTKPSKYVPDATAESFETFFERLRDYIDNGLKPLEGKDGIENVLVVCHGAVIRGIMSIANELKLDDFWDSTSQKNCSVNLFDITDGVFSFVWDRKLYYVPEEEEKFPSIY